MKKEDWWKCRLSFSHWVGNHIVQTLIYIMSSLLFIIIASTQISLYFITLFIPWFFFFIMMTMIRDGTKFSHALLMPSFEKKRIISFLNRKWFLRGKNQFVYFVYNNSYYSAHTWDIKPNPYLVHMFGKDYNQYSKIKSSPYMFSSIDNMRLATKKEIDEHGLDILEAKILLNEEWHESNKIKSL